MFFPSSAILLLEIQDFNDTKPALSVLSLLCLSLDLLISSVLYFWVVSRLVRGNVAKASPRSDAIFAAKDLVHQSDCGQVSHVQQHSAWCMLLFSVLTLY